MPDGWRVRTIEYGNEPFTKYYISSTMIFHMPDLGSGDLNDF